MKYVVLLCDHMADYPNKEIFNKTPLAFAKTPTMDYLAPKSQIGLVKTIPHDCEARYDISAMSIMGYNSKIYLNNKIIDWNKKIPLNLKSFYTIHNIKASVISRSNFVRGIARSAGMHLCDLGEPIGNIKDDYKKKIDLVSKEFNDGYELVYLHLELYDEDKSIEDKVNRIENLDKYMLKPLLKMLRSIDDDFKLMVISSLLNDDNNCKLGDPVPFLMYQSNQERDTSIKIFSEESARDSGMFLGVAEALIHLFINFI